MADRWEAQYQFWSSFGVPAYEENSVPTEDRDIYPRITYQAAAGDFDSNVFVNASVWTRSSSWLNADTLADRIIKTTKEMNPIPFDGGAIWITAEEKNIDNMGDPEDNMIKRKLLSVVLHYL